MGNAMKVLMRSRKFLLLVADVIASLILYFIGKYTNPSLMEDVQFLIKVLQPMTIMVIVGIAAEDAAEKFGQRIHIR